MPAEGISRRHVLQRAVAALAIPSGLTLFSGEVRGQPCPPLANWIKVYEGPGQKTNEIMPAMFGMDDRLYTKTEQGISVLGGTSPSASWVPVKLPDTIDEDYSCKPIGDYLYLFLKRRLYFASNSALPSGYWQEVASSIISPSNETINPIPLGSFKGQVYGWYWARDPIEQIQGFNICRSNDVGKTEMNWDLVGEFSFGHYEKISTPAFMLAGTIAWHPWLHNDRIWIGTNTRTAGSFGDVATYKSDGVEVWESSTGDRGSWSRINHPGFGAETIVSGNTIRTNQEIHSATIGFDGNGDFLLVGTATQWAPGGQIWRYDGTGVTGWQNMTPWWTYSNPVSPFTRRFKGLVSWDRLYAAEGYPSGNLGSYDYITNTWTNIVEGPHPFGPEEGGISALAAGPGHNLYALTTPADEVPFGQRKVRIWAAKVSCSL